MRIRKTVIACFVMAALGAGVTIFAGQQEGSGLPDDGGGASGGPAESDEDVGPATGDPDVAPPSGSFGPAGGGAGTGGPPASGGAQGGGGGISASPPGGGPPASGGATGGAAPGMSTSTMGVGGRGGPPASGGATGGGGMMGGAGMGPAISEDEQLESLVRQLLSDYSTSEDRAAREAQRDSIAQALDRIFDIRQERRMSELEALEKRVRRLRDTLGDRQRLKEEIVKNRLDYLLREADGLGWGDGIPPSGGASGGGGMGATAPTGGAGSSGPPASGGAGGMGGAGATGAGRARRNPRP